LCKEGFASVSNTATSEIECKCAPGYTLESGRCVLCAAGFYKSGVSNEACKKCNTDEHKEGVLGSITTNTPAISSMDCTCSKSEFRALEPPEANTTHYIGQCLTCPDGTDCSEPGITVESLPLLKGYWRSTASSHNIVQCYTKKACTHPNRTTTAADFSLDNQCAEGHTGPICNVCKKGHAKSVTGECDICVYETSIPDEMCVCERCARTALCVEIGFVPPYSLFFCCHLIPQVRVRGHCGRGDGGDPGLCSPTH
jgi:hypothetical protein